MGKDRSGLKLKGAGILHQNAGAQKIARKKIGGKLNAMKVAPKTPRKGACQQGFASARNIFQ
jgi:hypothetical protein